MPLTCEFPHLFVRVEEGCRFYGIFSYQKHRIYTKGTYSTDGTETRIDFFGHVLMVNLWFVVLWFEWEDKIAS